MKLPWDKKYLKISFHVIITVVLMYSLKLCIDLIAYILTNINTIFNDISNFIGWILSIFSVVVIAFIIAYLLDPLVDFFQTKYEMFYKNHLISHIMKNNFLKKIVAKHQSKNDSKAYKSRTSGTTIAYILLLSIIIVIFSTLVNKISKSGGSNLIESITLFINDSIDDFIVTYRTLENMLIEYGLFEYISGYISNFINMFTSFVSNIGTGTINLISSIGGGLINGLISIVIAFYFLKDKELIKRKFNDIGKTFLPHRFYTSLKNGLGDIDAVFSGYIRGQLLDASIMAVLISVGLSLLNIKFAGIIGAISGFSNVIPYFGALMGFVLAISVALLSGTPIKALYAAILMLVLQQIDSIIIVPKVVGESVELSPVLVLIALTVAGELFGLWGMVLAVPVFATIKLFMTRFFIRQKERKANNN